jgi:hypothetical protein
MPIRLIINLNRCVFKEYCITLEMKITANEVIPAMYTGDLIKSSNVLLYFLMYASIAPNPKVSRQCMVRIYLPSSAGHIETERFPNTITAINI